jgi:hypothetical protein
MTQGFAVCIRVAVTMSAVAIFSARLVSPERSLVIGTCRGEPVCVTDAPACRNETIVYSISDSPDRPDRVIIRADKIVDGKAITMGTGPWH